VGQERDATSANSCPSDLGVHTAFAYRHYFRVGFMTQALLVRMGFLRQTEQHFSAFSFITVRRRRQFIDRCRWNQSIMEQLGCLADCGDDTISNYVDDCTAVFAV